MAAWSRLPEGSKPIGGGPAPRGWSGRAFGSLRVPNYRLYAGAQLVSVTGTWMQIVAENWLVIRLTGSGLALGITTALQFMPLALAAPYGGLLVDRMNKRRLIAGTQTCAGLLALTTGLLTLFGLIRIWMVFVAALGLGFVNAVDDPAHQAFTQEMVGPGQVANAVALNDSISMGSRAFGPALAGILIATTGLGWAFMANALTSALVVLALVLMRPDQLLRWDPIPRRPGQIREGLRYAVTRGSIRTVLVILAIVATFGFNFQVLHSLLVAKTFRLGAESYGFLMSSMGGGSMLGSLIVAGAPNPTVRRVRLLAVAFGVSWAAMRFVPTVAVAFGAAALMGAAASMFLSSCAGSLQLASDLPFRGRVMALYTVAFLGTAPLGGPSMGYVAQAFGPRGAFVLGGTVCILAPLVGGVLNRRPGHCRKTDGTATSTPSPSR